MTKLSELRELSEADLEQLLQDKCKELFELNNELRVSRKLDKPHMLRSVKKTKARILTLMHQKRNK